MVKKTTEATVEVAQEAPEKKKVTRKPRAPRKKAAPAKKKAEETPVEPKAEEAKVEEVVIEQQESVTVQEVVEEQPVQPQETESVQDTVVENVKDVEDAKSEEHQEPQETLKVKEEKEVAKQNVDKTQKRVVAPANLPVINNIVELVNAPQRQIILSDQQINQLSLQEVQERHEWFEKTLARVLDYDIVLSDTNIWIELLVGKSSSHSDPQVNARLQFERQLEFISKMTKHRKGRFMMMSETYEEIDRFATQQEPTNYRDADWTDESLCRNVAARLAKRLILSQQRENRLRIEGIGSESHHSAFADPAIIRRTVEFFAQGKSVLLLTNDASVAIRSMGMCDDLQRHNNIDDESWDTYFAPLRPMVVTMDDLKVLDNFTRQYHFLQMAAGKQWMEDVPQEREHIIMEPLMLWQEGFRPGDRYKESKQQNNQPKQKQQQKQQPKQEQKQNAQPKQEAKQNAQPKQEQKQSTQPKQDNQPKQQKQQKTQKQNNQPKQEPKVEPAAQPVDEVLVAEQPVVAPETTQTESSAEQPAEVKQEQKAKPKRRPSSRRSSRSRKQGDKPVEASSENNQ